MEASRYGGINTDTTRYGGINTKFTFFITNFHQVFIEIIASPTVSTGFLWALPTSDNGSFSKCCSCVILKHLKTTS